MALKATIFKIDLTITDMDRDYYQSHSLTVARHPSENNQRMMLRILAFIANASETLEFTKGLSEVEEPDLWQKNLHEEIELWVELGQPSEQRIKKGSNAAKQMLIYNYDDNAFKVWWQKEQNKIGMKSNVSVITFPEEAAEQLANLTERHMNITVTVQDGMFWLNIEDESLDFAPSLLK